MKKSYLDKLEGIDKDGNKQSSFHIRLKGISPAAIEEHVRIERKINAKYDEWALYDRLFKGKPLHLMSKPTTNADFRKIRAKNTQHLLENS